MIILMGIPTVDEIAAKKIVADMYKEPLVRFTPDLDLAHVSPAECLSFCGHTYWDKQRKAMHFGAAEDTSLGPVDSAFFVGYTPAQFAEQLLAHGLSTATQTIELWGCGVGDTSSDYPQSYAKQLAIALAAKGYFPTIRATSAVAINTGADEHNPFTDFSMLVLRHTQKQQSTQISWHICAMRAKAYKAPPFIEAKEQLEWWREEMAKRGKDYMEIRSKVAQLSAQPDSTLPPREKLKQQEIAITKELAMIPETGVTEYYMDLLSDSQYEDIYDYFINIEDKYCRLLDDIRDGIIDLALVKSSQEAISKLHTSLMRAVAKIQTDLAVETPLTQAIATLRMRMKLYEELILIQQQIAISPPSPQEQCAIAEKDFYAAQEKVARYTGNCANYQEELASFLDIRQHLSRPECHFSIDMASYTSPPITPSSPLGPGR
ncbi:MAG: hypothetical protein A3E83_00285 [Gammaproteobacteria bacterium RIFCSPHIGHO2_12_FULL_41_20]|nr:MAG: hypothetical protein A3E83_00285 [Gammaproteobacteria bacterium RIFCSPHIGHO2_12_FULL_41_20]